MMALTTTGASASRSASANTTCADLPPSSSVTPIWFCAAAAWIAVPVWGLPVKEMKSMPGWGGRGRPAGAAKAGDDVKRALGEADLEREARDFENAQRSILGRLDDAG